MLCGFSSLWWPFGWNWSYLGFLALSGERVGVNVKRGVGRHISDALRGVLSSWCNEMNFTTWNICEIICVVVFQSWIPAWWPHHALAQAGACTERSIPRCAVPGAIKTDGPTPEWVLAGALRDLLPRVPAGVWVCNRWNFKILYKRSCFLCCVMKYPNIWNLQFSYFSINNAAATEKFWNACYNMTVWILVLQTERQIPQPNGLVIWLPVGTCPRALWQQAPPEPALIP